MFRRKRVFGAKIESVIGTPETLTAADCDFNAYNVEIQGDIEFEKREDQGSFDRLKGVTGARMGTVTLRTDASWDGTATLPSWATKLLPLCGVVENANLFTPRCAAPGLLVKTGTIAVWEDGVRKTLSGAVGTFRLVCPAGRTCYFEWTFTGVWQTPVAEALPTPTYPAPFPLRYAQASTTFAGVALQTEQATIDIANQITMRYDPTTESGYISGIIPDREPVASVNPEFVLPSVQDRYRMWEDADEGALTYTLQGEGTSTIGVTVPAAQIMRQQEGDREGIQTDDIEFSCNKNGANIDEMVQFLFTPTV